MDYETKNVELPVFIYDQMYWIHQKNGKLVADQVEVEGYDIRADAELNTMLIVKIRETYTGVHHRFNLDDMCYVVNKDDIAVKIEKIMRNWNSFPRTPKEIKDDGDD